MTERRFQSFQQFYPFYLSEHQHPSCRALHYIGLLAAIITGITLLFSNHYLYLPVVLVIGYGCSWLGHLVFEKNQPATLKYPLYSFFGDWLMTYQALRRLLSRKH